MSLLCRFVLNIDIDDEFIKIGHYQDILISSDENKSIISFIQFESSSDLIYPDSAEFEVIFLNNEGMLLGKITAFAEKISDYVGKSGSISGISLTCDALEYLTPQVIFYVKKFMDMKITEKGFWIGKNYQNKLSWLSAVSICRHSPTKVIAQNDRFVLSGHNIADSLDFFCALGESINNVGGYYGKCINSLIDCLSGGFGAVPPFDIEWINHKESMENLRITGDYFFIKTIIENLECRRVKVNLC